MTGEDKVAEALGVDPELHKDCPDGDCTVPAGHVRCKPGVQTDKDIDPRWAIPEPNLYTRGFDAGVKAAQDAQVTKHTRRVAGIGNNFEEYSSESLHSVELGETAKGEVYIKSVKTYGFTAPIAGSNAVEEYRRIKKMLTETPEEEG